MNKTISALAIGLSLMSAPLAMAQSTADNTTAMQPVPNPPTGDTPAQNVRDSHNYTAMIADSAAFRNDRIKKECGGIEDADLKQQCISSFPDSQSKPASKASN